MPNERIEKVMRANAGNLLKRLRDGKPLTQTQIAFLEKNLSESEEEKKETKDKKPEALSAGAFAQICNLDQRRVQQLAVEGVLQKEGRGKYPIQQVTCYIRYLQELVQQRKIKSAEPGTLDPDHERARKDAATADKIEMELAVRRGELIVAEEAVAEWTRVVMEIRNAILSLPARVSEEIAAMHKPRAVKQRLDQEVREILHDLSQTDDAQ